MLRVRGLSPRSELAGYAPHTTLSPQERGEGDSLLEPPQRLDRNRARRLVGRVVRRKDPTAFVRERELPKIAAATAGSASARSDEMERSRAARPNAGRAAPAAERRVDQTGGSTCKRARDRHADPILAGALGHRQPSGCSMMPTPPTMSDIARGSPAAQRRSRVRCFPAGWRRSRSGISHAEILLTARRRDEVAAPGGSMPVTLRSCVADQWGGWVWGWGRARRLDEDHVA